MRIDSITLDGVCPQVFGSCDGNFPAGESGVWCRKVTFTRPATVLVEAESGTGKSSLCSYIYGNRSDYSGTIRFNDRDIRELTVKDWCEVRCRHIALLPQEMRLFPELTVLENIAVKNRLTGFRSEAAIMSMLERLEIAGKAAEKAARLSVGQQQRVALVRALCQPFDFLLLDEPVSHLDRRNNAIAAELVAEEAARQDAAVIATSVGYPISITTDITYRL